MKTSALLAFCAALASSSAAISQNNLMQMAHSRQLTVEALSEVAFNPAKKATFDTFAEQVLHPPLPATGKWEGCAYADEWATTIAQVRSVQLAANPSEAEALWSEADEVVALGSRLAARQPSQSALNRPTALGRELARRVIADQAWRMAAHEKAHSPAADEVIGWRTLPQLCHVDLDNSTFMKRLLQEKGWPLRSEHGTDAVTDAWLLVQHADDDRQLQALVLQKMEPLLRRQEIGGEDYALLFDRVALANKHPQRFGTQFVEDPNGCLRPSPIEDPNGVDARRLALGLSRLAEYAATLSASYKHPVCPSALP